MVVADDEDNVRSYVRAYVERAGAEVVAETSDGRAVLDLIIEHDPDVVILDFTMAAMDGVEITRRIRESCPDVKVVGFTSHWSASIKEAMREAGALEILEKDDAKGLVGVLQELAAEVGSNNSAP